MSIAERELTAGPDAADKVRRLLDGLDCAGEPELAQRLRTGALSYLDGEVRRATSTAVFARLRVANPRYQH